MIIQERIGAGLAGFRWSSSARPKAVIQLAHGAGEHAMRYFGPLSPIIEGGYTVYAADHRGHGMTSGMTSLGDFAVVAEAARRLTAWCLQTAAPR